MGTVEIVLVNQEKEGAKEKKFKSAKVIALPGYVHKCVQTYVLQENVATAHPMPKSVQTIDSIPVVQTVNGMQAKFAQGEKLVQMEKQLVRIVEMANTAVVQVPILP